MAAGGPGGCTGRGAALWYSTLPLPAWAADAGGGVLAAPAANTFANLFGGGDPAAGNALFGLGRVQLRDRFRFRGPYLAEAGRQDPWGRGYLVVGYNQEGQAGRGPVWVVCAGPRGTVATANLRREPPAEWDLGGASEGNLVLRVH